MIFKNWSKFDWIWYSSALFVIFVNLLLLTLVIIINKNIQEINMGALIQTMSSNPSALSAFFPFMFFS